MAIIYKVPDKYYFRIHHIRPRFKNDVENVLISVATEISKIPKMEKNDFMEAVNRAIWRYPGNSTKTLKTIDNWRTEISSLFGLIEYDSDGGFCWPSSMAKNLAENQDLVEFFKYFLYYFQYPGGHLKQYETLKYIKSGIKFKPARYILNLLSTAKEETGKSFGITKAELTHCVFNDLRVTRDNRPIHEIVDLIIDNRGKNIDYNWEGDIIRYAGDILDYMVIADLLVQHGSKYYLNHTESENIRAFIENEFYFNSYDNLYGKIDLTIENINAFQDSWFHFVNQRIDKDIFKTDIFKYLGIEESEYTKLAQTALDEFYQQIGEGLVETKEIGDMGENLVLGHEWMRVKIGGRPDLIHLIVRIPNALGIGYDIQSIELDAKKRLIEVKSTISSKKISFNKFHLTPNEWNTAESFGERYFVYRLMISKRITQLFVIQNPVGKYKSSLIEMIQVSEGVDITFKENVGVWEKLLIWQS